jgi:hypothetical protein
MEASHLNDLINIIDGDPVLTNPQPEDFHDFIVDEDVFNYGANDYMTHTPPMKKVMVIIMMVLLLLDVYLKIIMLLILVVVL